MMLVCQPLPHVSGLMRSIVQQLQLDSEPCPVVESGCLEQPKGQSQLRRKLCRPLACLGPFCPIRPIDPEQVLTLNLSVQ